MEFTLLCVSLVLFHAPLNGEIDCNSTSGAANEGVEGDNSTFPCDPGYMLQENSCEENGNWSGGLPSCIPLNCSDNGLPVPAYATVLQLSSCGLAYQSRCTVSCVEGFTGDNVTYLCNVTNNPNMVDWIAINNTQVNHTCLRSMDYTIITMQIHSVALFLLSKCSYVNYYVYKL